MSAPAPKDPGRLQGRRPSPRRVWGDRLGTLAMLVATVLVLLPVGMILFQIAQKGLGTMSWEFLTQAMPYSYRKIGGGFFNALVGTAIMVGLATAVAVPLGVLAAIYLTEYGKKNLLATLIRFFSDVMTGVPSIFVGLFVYTAFVLPFGFGAVMGAAALAIIMLPIVVRSTEEMLKLVPRELKDASYALGAGTWQTTVRVVLPSALPGITTGVLLAVARAAGETAPLILTTLGAIEIVTKLVGAPISALPLAIFDGARSPFAAGQERAWAGALELLLIVLVFTLLARVAASRSRISR
ncbi:MAG: phosphate ABC transporter permease PstA [Thermoleophilia bacterium]|nr:phosphate ABC transporter permease PstA [Thermoleophilia bacterium]